MSFGPILRRELFLMARRRSMYMRRCWTAFGLLAVIGFCGLAWDLAHQDRSSIEGQGRFTKVTFTILVGIQAITAIGVIPSMIAPAITAERERKSLDALLTTRLTNAEIVLEIVAAGLVRAWVDLAIGLSVVALMSPLWGIDPRLVVLSYGGLAATAFAVAGLSAVAAVESRNSRRANTAAAGLLIGWISAPLVVLLLLPKLWPWGGRLLAPIASLLVESSPVALVLNISGILRRGEFIDAMWRMIGWELLGGALLILWAIARLRRASRGVYDGEVHTLIRRLTRPIWRRQRPPCGNDPVFWNEVHQTRGRSELERLVGELIGWALLVCFLMLMFWIAMPAFRELGERGYVANGGKIRPIEIHPFVRWLVLGPKSGPQPGEARAELNIVVRQLTTMFYVMFLLVTAGLAAETVIYERRRDTWSGLLATPLTGREIITSKMLGAIWRCRAYVALALGTWVLALVAGAVHPLGFLVSLAGLASTAWCFSALGIYASLRFLDRHSAVNMAILPSVFLAFGGLVLLALPQRGISILLGSCSMPIVGWLSLVSYDDMQFALRTGEFPIMAQGGIRTGEGAIRVAATCLIGITAQTVAAFLMTRAAIRGFDASVGRPVRSKAPPELAPTDGDGRRLVVFAGSPAQVQG